MKNFLNITNVKYILLKFVCILKNLWLNKIVDTFCIVTSMIKLCYVCRNSDSRSLVITINSIIQAKYDRTLIKQLLSENNTDS